MARDNPNFHFHYVSAREMYNLIKAAESGYSGKVADALDFELLAPPVLRNLAETGIQANAGPELSTALFQQSGERNPSG